MNIYSKVEPDVLTHIVFRLSDFTDGREEIVSPHEYLQCAALKMKEGKTFLPHRHIKHKGKNKVHAQEAWVVISGTVLFVCYDLDDSVLCKTTLEAGDVCFTLRGGHTYRTLEDDCKVLEFKTGPYYGVKLDKQFIDEV